MDREYELVELLRVFPRDDDQERKLQALVAATMAEARLPARVAARLYANGDGDVARGAFVLLQGAQELAIAPLLDGPHPAEPARIFQSVDLVVQAELELRTRVMQRIDSLLADRRPVPPPLSLGPVEEKPDDRRVCDVAYVAMRRLVHLGESAWDRITGARAFYRSPRDDRDAAIAEARRTNEWRHALRGPDANDEDPPP